MTGLDEGKQKMMRSVSELMNLSGKKALIVGGGGKLGLTAAETLLELGARVALGDLKSEGILPKVESWERFHETDSFVLEMDLLDDKTTREQTRKAVERLGGLDIIIHAAGYVGTTDVPGWVVPFAQQQTSAFADALQVNLTSAFVVAQEAAPALSESGCGSIIFISSIYGLVGPDLRLYEGTEMNNPAGYNASKGGLIQLTRYLSTVLAPKTRVNVISPGGVWRNQPEQFHQRYIDRTPLGRMAVEEDLKGAFAYLASDLSAYVTGQNLVVDGGWTVW